ncbi:MAG: rhomboid family intramembrane serine protease [Chthoniobacterales bacterium]
MSFLDHLERRLPWLAVPGLIRFVALFNALVFLLHLIAPGYESVLTLNREAILEGQVWRLVTWIFIPETFQPFWILFALLFLWFLGDGLEAALGPFRTTLFYVTGMIACTSVALIFGSYGANTFLNLSLLYAFATLHPDYQVLFFFIIPMRIGWLALVSCVLTAIGTLGQPAAAKAALVVTLANYLLFFWPILLSKYQGSLGPRTQKIKIPLFKKKSAEEEIPLHSCVVCKQTDKTAPHLDFRVAADGEEYCVEHLSPRDKVK